jgi:hypothetical protein
MWSRIAIGGCLLAICLSFAAPGVIAAEPEVSTTKSQLQSYLDTNVIGQACPPVSESELKNIDLSTRKIPDEAQQLLIAWLNFSGWRRKTYYVFSVGIILFAALASALKDGEQSWGKWKTAAALLATLFGGLNSTLAPYAEHKKFDDAFVVLNAAKLAYLTNPRVSLCDIGKAVAYAESIIHKGE